MPTARNEDGDTTFLKVTTGHGARRSGAGLVEVEVEVRVKVEV